jgi:hypothetical protein
MLKFSNKELFRFESVLSQFGVWFAALALSHIIMSSLFALAV